MNKDPQNEVKIAGMTWRSPVALSSGTIGFGFEYQPYIDYGRLGAIVVKSVTKTPWPGNPPPRIVETSGGILNSIGLQNPGVEEFVTRILPQLKEELDIPIIVNIAGFTEEDYVSLAVELAQAAGLGVAALEVNISCPNVRQHGRLFGAYPDTAAAVVAKVRRETDLPLITKLSACVSDLVGTARAVAAAGSDALSLINTVPGMAIDIANAKPVLGNISGGLSGPAVKPIALKAVYDVSQAVDIPVIGMGGISSVEDALEFIYAGAAAVSIGTGVFVDPGLPNRVADGLAAFCRQQGLRSVAQLTGLAWKGLNKLDQE